MCICIYTQYACIYIYIYKSLCVCVCLHKEGRHIHSVRTNCLAFEADSPNGLRLAMCAMQGVDEIKQMDCSSFKLLLFVSSIYMFSHMSLSRLMSVRSPD